MATEAKAQTELHDFESLFSLEGKVVVVVCSSPPPFFYPKNDTNIWLSRHVLGAKDLCSVA